MPRLSWMSPANFSAGHPWKHGMEYFEERAILPAVQPGEEALSYR